MNRTRRVSRWVTVLVAVGLFAAACGDDGASSDDGATTITGNNGTAAAGPTTTKPPKIGGSVTVFVPNDRASLDNVVGTNNGSTDAPVFIAIYDQLIRVDREGKVEPRLAQSVTSTDNKVWKIKLRDKLTFSDGTVFDAAAVKFNWDRMAKTTGRGQSDAKALTSIVVDDATSLTITLAEPNSEWPRRLMANLGWIGSPTAFTALGDKFAAAPVAAGPFVLKSWTRDSEMVLVRNPTYWDAPRPYLDEVKVEPLLDAAQRYNSFKANEADLIFLVAPSNELSKIKDGTNKVVDDPDSIGGTGLLMNVTRAPLNDIRVRQALGYALNLDDINKKLTGGGLTMVTDFIPKSSPYYDPSLTNRVGDPAKAQALINDYVASKGGGPVTVTINVSSQFALLGQVIQQQLSQIQNLKFEILPSSAAELVENRGKSNFDIILGAVAGADPDSAFAVNLKTGLTTNYGKYSNPAVDASLAKAVSVSDPAVKKAEYLKVAQAILNDAPFVALFRLPIFWGFQNNISGVRVFDTGVIDLGVVSKN
ncbi:MAG: ABC transporter substrate-binding protein [Acidimicrobiales bacterium]